MSASGGDPAQRLVTQQNWEDLALAPETLGQVRDMHKELAAADDPGTYRVVFSGPAGTGKTLTATLLGQQFGRDVYRIDLSQVVSKFIGETEKNLEHLLARAEQEDWILFFDEADALFGNRTDVRDAHDRYSNEEVAALLQRIEAYDGLVIVATHHRGNIDAGFLRRCQAIIKFTRPRSDER